MSENRGQRAEGRRLRAEDRKQKLRRWEGEMRRGLSLHKLKMWNYSILDFRYKASLSTFQTARYALCPLLYALFARNSQPVTRNS